jgi:DivIVA domain-containing protein
MELTAKAIREVEFREKMRGYHPDDVDAFVERVATSVEALTQRIGELEGGGDEGEQVVTQDTLRRTLLLAQKTADQLSADAQRHADQIVTEARAEAEALLAEANDTVQRSIQETQRRMDEDLSGVQTRRAQLQTDIAALESYVLEQRTVLRAALLEQLRLLEEGAGKNLDPPAMARPTAPVGPPDQEAPRTDPFAEQEAADDHWATDVPSESPRHFAPAEEVALHKPVDALSEEPVTVDEPSATSTGRQDAAETRPTPAPDPDDPYDVFSRGRGGSRVPGEGEDDPFLDELRRAVDDQPPSASGPQPGGGMDKEADEQDRPDPPPTPPPSPATAGDRPEGEEPPAMPAGGRMSDRLFRRR